MQNIQFPVNFEFNISTLANDFKATDASGQTIAYVRQKMFKLKEDIQIFNNDSKTKVNYRIKADKWLDFSTAYSFYDESAENKTKSFGKVVRKGWRSIWKAQYQIIDQNEKQQYTISEENAWVKVGDSLLGEIPILNFFTGYLFNPSYIVVDMNGNQIIRLKKLASFFGRKFELSKLGDMDADDDDRVMLSLMMMILLERRRG
ncbi:hypothetical protein GCM10011344_44050 [Dokdonia pacifica]|uniref:LURP-one-related n=1 Tax=Dokdonia pacifica TaxID=1627892 RepID=A0A239CJT5_9FLAO|nr:hypothetical protein [Dokdonia pacifica]GGG38374.1 hypothetical protein GCM10011344_44050 [Dokdonia pacifica]SNS20142.1 hypothetical protein SAMN06265376_10830 [Dokdonia pacifica]